MNAERAIAKALEKTEANLIVVLQSETANKALILPGWEADDEALEQALVKTILQADAHGAGSWTMTWGRRPNNQE